MSSMRKAWLIIVAMFALSFAHMIAYNGPVISLGEYELTIALLMGLCLAITLEKEKAK